MRRILFWAGILLGTLTLGAAPLKVVCLHSVLSEFAGELGGADIELVSLVPAGIDPHSFNPVPSDVRKLAAADVVLATGAGLEPWLDKLVRNSGFKGRLVEASDFVPPALRPDECSSGHGHGGELAGAAHDHAHHERDPHWWHGIAAARQVVAGIARAFSELRPELAPAFAARSARVDARLQSLASWATGYVEQLPRARRQLVTMHDAFGFLARELGFTVHALNGVSAEAETDAKSLARLIRLIQAEKIKAVFVDSTENPRLLANMLRESGAVNGGTLYADGLGVPEGPAGTYEAMYRHNLKTMVEALR